MAQNGPRAGCLETMAKHNVEEAMEVAIKMVCRQKGWGDKGRKFKVWPILPLFGAALKPYLTELEKQISEWEASGSDKLTKAVKQQREWLEQIKRAKPHPMISIKKYIKDDPGPVIVR
jgi:hypothetical protein